MTGNPGDYKIQLLLSRPGHPYSAEREHKFIDDVIGDSHIAITKPKADRTDEDANELFLQMQAAAQAITVRGLPNAKGFLGKLLVGTLKANSFHDAENLAYQSIAPLLSSWSVHLDVPVHVDTIQVAELSTGINSLRVRTPTFEMAMSAGATPHLSEDFCQYASLYREGMNSNNGFYRFLCFYKIIEGIPQRRSRLAKESIQRGEEFRRDIEVVPATTEELLKALKNVYPWRNEWDTFVLDQIAPPEIRGKKLGWVREKYLNPLRVGIAHALLKDGEVRIRLDNLEHIQLANKWLPLTRVMARVLLRSEFPTEFAFELKPWSPVISPSGMSGAPSPEPFPDIC